MGYFELKARKGVIKVKTSVEEGVLRDVEISGDFFFYPEEAFWRFKNCLKDTRADYDEILRKIESFFKSEGVRLVGCSVEDFAKAVYYSAIGGEGT